MILEASAAAFLVADFIYHRWFEDKPVKKLKPQEVSIPRVDEGSPVPLIYGRVRVRGPILAWQGKPYPIFAEAGGVWAGDTDRFLYAMSMHFVLGVGFADGTGDNYFHGAWLGEQRLGVSPFSTVEPEGLTGTGGFEPLAHRLVLSTIYKPNRSRLDAEERDRADLNEYPSFGDIEFLNGNSSQTIVDASGDPQTFLGEYMTVTTTGAPLPEQDLSGDVPVGEVSSYYGYLSVFMFARISDLGSTLPKHWTIGGTSMPMVSFEASSYKSTGGYPAVGICAQVGQDSNPANVIYDLLVAKFGKLGIDSAYIDLPSFQAAATTLYNESHGYSRCIEESRAADDVIKEILAQIDGALDEDPSTGKLVIKLIRNDYDPTTIPHITKANCSKLTNFSAGGWSDVINKIRLIYTDRSNDYNDGSVIVHNQGLQTVHGVGDEQVVEMRGACFESLAKKLAERELAARSRPLIKCRAIVDRTLLSVTRGDAVKVTFGNVSGLVFRVADVDRGTLDDGRIALDLIQDYFYVWRNQAPKTSGLGGIGVDNPVVLG